MSEPTRQQKILLQQQKQREAAQKRRQEANKKRQEAQKNRRVKSSKARNIQTTTRRQTTGRPTTRRVNNQLKDAQACIHNQGETGKRVPVG